MEGKRIQYVQFSLPLGAHHPQSPGIRSTASRSPRPRRLRAGPNLRRALACPQHGTLRLTRPLSPRDVTSSGIADGCEDRRVSTKRGSLPSQRVPPMRWTSRRLLPNRDICAIQSAMSPRALADQSLSPTPSSSKICTLNAYDSIPRCSPKIEPGFGRLCASAGMPTSGTSLLAEALRLACEIAKHRWRAKTLSPTLAGVRSTRWLDLSDPVHPVRFRCSHGACGAHDVTPGAVTACVQDARRDLIVLRLCSATPIASTDHVKKALKVSCNLPPARRDPARSRKRGQWQHRRLAALRSAHVPAFTLLSSPNACPGLRLYSAKLRHAPAFLKQAWWHQQVCVTSDRCRRYKRRSLSDADDLLAQSSRLSDHFDSETPAKSINGRRGLAVCSARTVPASSVPVFFTSSPGRPLVALFFRTAPSQRHASKTRGEDELAVGRGRRRRSDVRSR